MAQLVIQGELPSMWRMGRVPIHLERAGPESIALTVLADFSEATHQVVNLLGRPFITHRSEADPVISQGLATDGYWEATESLALCALASPGATLVDAGANIGYYTLLFARLAGPAGRVLAFEPEPHNFLVLTANSLLWCAIDPQLAEIVLFELALSNRTGQMDLQIHAGNLGFHHLVAQRSGGGEFISASVDRLDRVWTQNIRAAGSNSLEIIKADVQGHELPLLLGAAATIGAFRPILCLEFEPYVAGVEACRQLLAWLSAQRYGGLRLIYADARQPRSAVEQLARVRTTAELQAELHKNTIGAYATLLAYPLPD